MPIIFVRILLALCFGQMPLLDVLTQSFLHRSRQVLIKDPYWLWQAHMESSAVTFGSWQRKKASAAQPQPAAMLLRLFNRRTVSLLSLFPGAHIPTSSPLYNQRIWEVSLFFFNTSSKVPLGERHFMLTAHVFNDRKVLKSNSAHLDDELKVLHH